MVATTNPNQLCPDRLSGLQLARLHARLRGEQVCIDQTGELLELEPITGKYWRVSPLGSATYVDRSLPARHQIRGHWAEWTNHAGALLLALTVLLAPSLDALASAPAATQPVRVLVAVDVHADGRCEVADLQVIGTEQVVSGEARVRVAKAVAAIVGRLTGLAEHAEAKPSPSKPPTATRPADTSDKDGERTKCTATAKSSGKRCRLYARQGQETCHMHTDD